ncbi:tail fiber domain-containing protein [Achromobacter sp. AGC39]
MAFQDIPKTTAVRDSLSILLDNDRSAHELAGAAIPKAEKGAAEGVATLDKDGRHLSEQLPLAALLPTATHDLNTYTAPGAFYQGAVAAATLESNYPVANVSGFLLVDTYGTATLQQFSTRNAPYQQFWRIKTGATAWSAWKEGVDHTTGLMFQGVMAASQDLNTYTQRGVWIIASSGVAGGGTNFPIGQSGTLIVYSAGYPGGTSATGANQIYIASNSNLQFFRSLVGGTWSGWERFATLSSTGRLPAEQAPSTILLPTTAHSLDDIRTAGVYAQNATAGAVAGTSYPAPFAGLLEVHGPEGVAAANLLWQEYTVYGVEGGSPVGFGGRRYWRSCSNRTNGNWGPWREVARTSDVMTHTFLTAATDANTLTADNTFYTWTASAAVGANFPTFSTNWASAGFMRVYYGASTQVSQELTLLVTGQKPRTFFRFGNSANNTWQSWKSTSAWSTSTGLPTTDCGDIYVDGLGWHNWDSATSSYLPMSTALEKKGGVINGALTVGGGLAVSGLSNLNGSVAIASAAGASIRLTQLGTMENTLRVSGVGFDVVNNGYSAVNMSVRNSNGDGIFRGSVYANNGGAALSGDGNVNGTLWGGWLSTWLSSQLNARPMRDGTSFVGFASNDIRSPYMKHDPTGAIVTLIRNLSGVYSVRRLNGYLEYDTDAGVIGTNYFVSDARTKRDIAPSKVSATNVVDKLSFYSFRFKEGAEGKGNDPTKVHQLGVLAQDIQKIDPAYVEELSDGTLQPNTWNLLTLALKALQEANARITILEKRLAI